MPDATVVSLILRNCSEAFDGQAQKSLELVLQLLECSPAPFSRNQFTPGHITCSGLVLAPDRRRVLLVHHRRLERWLLPGGHVEPQDESIAGAARREVEEETGALVNPAYTIAGADVHGIPAKRGEPYHLHHDLLFAFQAISEDIQTSEESHAVAWCAPAEFDRYQIPDNVRRAYARLLT
ncbi:MAG: NUDIX hydrolase [Candidatus Solibacter sp.]